MPPSSDPSRSGPAPLFSAPGLSVVALVLLLLFASTLAAALFPLQPLAPAWQWRLASTLISGAPFALLGLALLRIASELGPHDPRLSRRAQLFSQLAVVTALGFLLLLPLQTMAGLQQGRSLNQAQAGRFQRAEAKLKALRQAVASATTNADLNERIQALQGPVLGPADIAQPLPLLKAQVGAVLDQGDQQLRRDRVPAGPTPPCSSSPSCSARPSPAWCWPSALPPWLSGPAHHPPCSRSCAGTGSGSRAASLPTRAAAAATRATTCASWVGRSGIAEPYSRQGKDLDRRPF